MAWDKERTLLFIEKYGEIRELWDPKHPQHFNKIIKQDGCVKLSDQFVITVEILPRLSQIDPIITHQKKITSLLASLKKEKSKMKKSASGTGKGAEEVHTSTWFAYAALSFILDRYEPLKTTDSIPCETGTQDLQETRDKPPENPDAPQRQKAKVYESEDSTRLFKFCKTLLLLNRMNALVLGNLLLTNSRSTLKIRVQHHISNILLLPIAANMSTCTSNMDIGLLILNCRVMNEPMLDHQASKVHPHQQQFHPPQTPLLSSPEASINSQESEGFMREFGDLID